MKKIIITLLFASAAFVSCDDAPTTGNVSKITNYPIITVTGDNPYFVPQGATYVDPGAVAMAGSTEVPVTTTAAGKYRHATTLDTSITDEYAVTYSAVNSDGFAGTASRKVIVYKTGDLVNSLEGVYTCTISRNGATPSAAYQNIKYIYIWKNGDGTYEVSDAFGGWYEFGRGLGPNYATPGGKINAIDISTNTFTFPGGPLTNPGFGGTANITDVQVNPVTKKIVMTCTWLAPPSSNYLFVATLTQVQL
jgi:hypothetical protein